MFFYSLFINNSLSLSAKRDLFYKAQNDWCYLDHDFLIQSWKKSRRPLSSKLLMCAWRGRETSLKNPTLHSSWGGSDSNKLYVIISWSLFKAVYTQGRSGPHCFFDFFDLSEVSVSDGMIGFCPRRMTKMKVLITFTFLSDYCLLWATPRWERLNWCCANIPSPPQSQACLPQHL